MQQHDVELVPEATALAAVHEQGAGQAFPLFRRHVTVLAALAVLCTSLAWASAGSRWRLPVCGGPALEPSQRAHAAAAEPPDNATFAICTIINLAADDPQWVDGRAEDLHEVRQRYHATSSQ